MLTYFKVHPVVQYRSNFFRFVPHEQDDDDGKEINNKEICNHSFLETAPEMFGIDALDENDAWIDL